MTQTMSLSPPSATGRRLEMLVAIASYGDRNLRLLQEVIRRYREMSVLAHIVVLSNAPKELGPDVEVVVGLPAKNPWSLPFAHKRVFADRVDDYDLFVYTEDDMALTEANVQAFLRATPVLADDEIAGFLRYEVDEAGNRHFLDAHGRYHWQPESGGRRGDYTVAQFTNEHAALYMLTRAQLKRAIASGNFLRPPYADRYDMLCTAATDPYTVCGFRKVICISALDDFVVHHLSNRYAGKWGISWEAFQAQVRIQLDIVEGRHPVSTLCHSETRMPHCEWSKSYYELPIDGMLELVPDTVRTVLSIGSGWGAAEEKLQQRGITVTLVPLDSVIGAVAEQRGMEVIYGSFDEAHATLRERRFDCALMSNLLHLVPDPEQVIKQWSRLVRPDGAFVISGPNFESLRVKTKRILSRAAYQRLRSFEASGVRVVGPRTVSRYLRGAGLERTTVRWLDSSGSRNGKLGVLASAQWALRASA